MDTHSVHVDRGHSIFGLALLLAGVAMLLGNWGLLPHLHLGRYLAPGILIVLGLTRMAASRAGRPRGGATLLTVGVLLLLANLQLWSFRESWPIFLVVAGLGMMWKATRRRQDEEGVLR